MSEQSQGPGWWLASDGKWYSPEQVPFATAGPAVGPDQPETTPTIWRLRWFLITAAVVGLLIVIGALSPSKGEDKIATESSNSSPEEDNRPHGTTTLPPTTTTTTTAAATPVPGDGYEPPAGVVGLTQTPGLGGYICDEIRRDLQGGVDDVMSDSQREVDRMIAENPELAPYAADTKRILAESEPDVRAILDQGLAANGC